MANVDCPDTVYEYKYDSEADLANVTMTKHLNKNEFTFLPAWYTTPVNIVSQVEN